MPQQQTILLTNATSFFSSQHAILLSSKAEEYRQIEAAFDTIIAQYPEPLSDRKRVLLDAVAKTKQNVLGAFKKKQSQSEFRSYMNLANRTKILIDNLINNRATHQDIGNFKRSFNHDGKQEHLFAINAFSYLFIGLCVSLSPIFLGVGLPVLIAAGVGLSILLPIVLTSIYQYRTEPSFQIACAAKRFLDENEEAQYQGLLLNEDYKQLEQLFKQLLAHRSKKLSIKQQKLLDIIESLEKEILTDFKNDARGFSYSRSLEEVTKIKELVDKVMTNQATKEDLAAFETNFAKEKKIIIGLNLLTVTMTAGAAAFGFAFGIFPGVVITTVVLAGAITYAAFCAYLYFSKPKVQVARACSTILNLEKAVESTTSGYDSTAFSRLNNQEEYHYEPSIDEDRVLLQERGLSQNYF
jgi:hypothetical protein